MIDFLEINFYRNLLQCKVVYLCYHKLSGAGCAGLVAVTGSEIARYSGSRPRQAGKTIPHSLSGTSLFNIRKVR